MGKAVVRRLLLVGVATATLVATACSGTSNGGANGTPGGTASAPGAAAHNGTSPSAPDTSADFDVATSTKVFGTDGRAFIGDARGRAHQFRGFNIKTRDPLGAASDQAFADGEARGFDLLRLSIYWDQIEPEQGRIDESYLDAVGTVLDRARAHGFLVILDMHQDVFGAAFGDHGIPTWATRTDGLPYTQHEIWLQNYLEPAVQAAWQHLYEDPDLRQAQANAWLTVVNRFHDHPALLGYDLLNEPFGKLGADENIVVAAARVQREQLTPMFQRISDAIRTVDRDRWVFIHPPNVASLGVPVSLGAVNDPKLAYFPHMYDSSIETATYTPGAQVQGYDPTFFDKYEKAIVTYPMEHQLPVFIGEWGIAHPERPGMDEFVARSLALMERISSGWTVFNWCRGESYCPVDKAGQDRVAIGQIVQPWARAIVGSPTSYTWDPKASTLTVVFRDSEATGTTDLIVPTTMDPPAWKVTASDADGQWHADTDPATGLIRVTTPKTGGEHTINLARS